MRKIPFDIKYRPEIEAGKYKVVTEFGEPARIICWDSKYHASLPIIALVDDGDGEDIIHFGADGKLSITGKLDGTILWIITDEPEMTVEDLKKAVESGGNLPPWLESAFCKRYFEGYSKGQEEAEKRFRESTSYHVSMWPPCLSGGPCTNPYHDCINCPRPGTTGITGTNTNVK